MVRRLSKQLAEQQESEHGGPFDPVRVITVWRFISTAISARQRLTWAEDVDKAMRDNLQAYIMSERKEQLNLSTASRPEYIGTPEDFSSVLEAAYISQDVGFHCTEERIGFTFFIKLLAYTVSRPGELLYAVGTQRMTARFDMQNGDITADQDLALLDSVQAAEKRDALCWQDFQLSLVNIPTERIPQASTECKERGFDTLIAAKITSRLMKGKRYKDDEFKCTVLLLDKAKPMLCPILNLLVLSEVQGGMWEQSASELLWICENGTFSHSPGTSDVIPMR